MSLQATHEAETRRSAVFLTPAQADFFYLREQIGKISAPYDAPVFEPHVTVTAGYFSDLAVLQRELAAVVAWMPPFTLRAQGLCWTEQYFRTLFIEFEPNPFLNRLHDCLKGISGASEYEFTPHLSLLYADLPPKEKESLMRRTVLDPKDIHFDRVKIVVPQDYNRGWRNTSMWQTVWEDYLQGGKDSTAIRAVLLDFGGVLADEGFREGLFAIARSQGLDPQRVHRLAAEAVYASGYVVGKGSEADFWALLKERVGIEGENEELTFQILSRFELRPRIVEAVRRLRSQGFVVALLSDQTDWLERLDEKYRFYREFDRIFNSYRMGKGKRDPSLFTDVMADLAIPPRSALFVDDTPGNIERAGAQGLRTILFEDEEQFLSELERYTCKPLDPRQ